LPAPGRYAVGRTDTDGNAYGKEVELDVVRLLDHLEIQRAHVVGYSMGAAIVAKLLTTHPGRFFTATLGGSAGRRNWSVEDDCAAEAEAMEFERGTPFRSVILRTWPTDEPPPSEATIQQLSHERMKRGNDPVAVAAAARGRRGHAVTDAELAAVRVPTLAVVGSADAAIGRVWELKKVWPAVTVVIINGATHTGARGATGRPEFVNAIREFIRLHQQGTTRQAEGPPRP
jgi:pimeloyl-ACP methyl ester carboxylesterase